MQPTFGTRHEVVAELSGLGALIEAKAQRVGRLRLQARLLSPTLVARLLPFHCCHVLTAKWLTNPTVLRLGGVILV